jgi:hypothetical protein
MPEPQALMRTREGGQSHRLGDATGERLHGRYTAVNEA